MKQERLPSWLKAPVSKTGSGVTQTWVQIPPSPPAYAKASAGKPTWAELRLASQPGLNFGWQDSLRELLMWFVYVLRSRRDKDLYIGSTNDIQRRLAEHNSGLVESTKPRLPFDLEAYVAVRDKARAIELEQYFKTGSGKAVLLKRIL